MKRRALIQLTHTTLRLCAWLFWTHASSAAAEEPDPPLSYYRIIEERNFFKPNVQPAELEQEQADQLQSFVERVTAEGAAVAPNLTVTGIIRMPKGNKAIIEKEGGNGFYVGVGDMVDEYIVTDIHEDVVVLEHDEKQYMLELKTKRPKNPLQLKDMFEDALPSVETEQPDTVDYGSSQIQKLRTGGQE